MKRITVITPANGIWTLPKQPFHRCLLLANLSKVISFNQSPSPTLEANIKDASDNIIWQTVISFIAFQTSNFVFSEQGCETETTGLSPFDDFYGHPLPRDLTIPANLVFRISLTNWSGQDQTPNLIVTTDDPFLDGARPFDDLQAP